MARTAADLKREIEIREGNIGLYKDRIPKWQKMVDDMANEIPVLEQEIVDLRKELEHAKPVEYSSAMRIATRALNDEGFDVT